jgi:hypothetical protein
MSADLEPRCPNCKSCAVVPFLGAMPGFQPYDTVDIGRLPAAQCVATKDVVIQWECSDCGHKWSGGEEPAPGE